MTSSHVEVKRREALLIFPLSFYSFADEIQKALSNEGYNVVAANHEYPANTIGKILGNLRIFWPLSVITEYVLSRDYLSGRYYDLVLIVKGRGISRQLIKKLRQASSKIVAYNFDSFGYNPSPLRWYMDVDKYCTFDYVDSKVYALPLVDLFSSVPADERPKRIRYDVSAILRNHSNRLKFLDAVLNIIPSGNTFIYVLELNIFTLIINFLRNPRLYIKYRTHIHFKPLPYAQYVSVLKDSNFTLDYAHPKQSGITIRCFEALSTQTKVITNNRFVKSNPFMGNENVIVFDKESSPMDVQKQFESIKSSTPVKYRRTVSDFLKDLLA
jgi:hypothetical protein